MDEFNFGRPSRAPQLNVRTMTLAGVALVVGVAIVAIAFQSFGRSVRQIGQSQATVIQQVDTARDLQAQTSARAAASAASAAYQEAGSFADAGPDQLALLDPSVTYTLDPSTGPAIVSVASAPATWAGAVLSPSGTCFYVKLSVVAPPHYGVGDTCTGEAAMAASSTSW